MFIKNGHLPWCPTLNEPCHCKTAGYVIVAVFALLLAGFEVWGGIGSFSLMLLADAWHVSSDVVVYTIAIWGNVMAVRHLVGIQNIKNRWAIWNANILIVVAVATMVLAAKRLFYPEELFSEQMVFVASVGLSTNGVMYLILTALRIEHEHNGGEHESRDDKHDHLHDTAIWHTASDSLLSLVVVSVGWSIWKFPELVAYYWIDPVASLPICAGLIFAAEKMKREIKGQATNHSLTITRKFSIKFRF